jgi:hypothetical protein
MAQEAGHDWDRGEKSGLVSTVTVFTWRSRVPIDETVNQLSY